MSRYYKILEKARRAGDLFGLPTAESEPSVLEPEAQPVRVPWRQVLAELTCKPETAQASRLGLFGFEDRSLSMAGVALAQWMAAHADEPTLLVEASWRHSAGLASLLRVDRRGLGEALAGADPETESLIDLESVPNVAVMVAGRLPKADGAGLAGRIASLLRGLRRRFPNVLLLMPPADSPDWLSFAEAGLVDAGLAVVRPGSTGRLLVETGMERVRRTGFPLAGCLLDTGLGADVALRLSHPAAQRAPEWSEPELEL
jgi:hypothetical protein